MRCEGSESAIELRQVNVRLATITESDASSVPRTANLVILLRLLHDFKPPNPEIRNFRRIPSATNVSIGRLRLTMCKVSDARGGFADKRHDGYDE